MTTTAKRLKRIFIMAGTRLQDPDPALTPDQVRERYADDFPNLNDATVAGPVVEDDELVYTFETEPVKTKGHG